MNKQADSQDEKTELFMGLFAGLKNVYGSYDIKTGKAYQVKAMVDKKTIISHLWGSQPYGVYLLVGDKIRAIAVDFDTNDLIPVVRFTAKSGQLGIPVYIERSKSKGYHIWIFFEHPVAASKARAVVHYILNKIGYSATEVFPKRDRLDEKVSYGNFINTPLFCLSAKHQRTVFVDPENNYLPFEDQWQLLYNIEKSSEDRLDCLIKKLNLITSAHVNSTRTQSRNRHENYSLPPCKQKMLDQGVTQYQRLSCFRIAICLRRTGVSFDSAISMLKAWATRNRPQNGKRIITEKEIIAQTRSAYTGRYRSVGCECPSVIPFCDPNCPIRNTR
ncbi:MAG: hypothetical protein JXA96_13245 [Sedimentisphaerales bacterium]|nr:hypothetical protein [Sedimentisphaerales bacterium]